MSQPSELRLTDKKCQKLCITNNSLIIMNNLFIHELKKIQGFPPE